MDVLAHDLDIATCDAGGFHQIIHAVEAADQGGLTAPGWPDKGRDLLFRNIQGDIAQGIGFTLIVGKGEVLDFDHRFTLKSILGDALGVKVFGMGRILTQRGIGGLRGCCSEGLARECGGRINIS